MASSQVVNSQKIISVCNKANNYIDKFNLNPAIVGVNYCRILASNPSLVRADFIRPIYTLSSTQTLEQPYDVFPADKTIQYKLASNSISYNYIQVVEPVLDSYTFVIEFFENELDPVIMQ